MGLIERQIRKRGNQRLAEALTTVTALSIPDAIEAVKNVCEAHNRAISADLARRRTEGGKLKRMAAEGTKATTLQYHVLVHGQDVLIGYQHSPQFILTNAKRKHLGWSAGWWLAVLRFPQSAKPLPAGHHLVEIRLANWVTDSNGKLENKHKYEALTDAIWQALSSGPASTTETPAAVKPATPTRPTGPAVQPPLGGYKLVSSGDPLAVTVQPNNPKGEPERETTD